MAKGKKRTQSTSKARGAKRRRVDSPSPNPTPSRVATVEEVPDDGEDTRSVYSIHSSSSENEEDAEEQMSKPRIKLREDRLTCYQNASARTGYQAFMPSSSRGQLLSMMTRADCRISSFVHIPIAVERLLVYGVTLTQRTQSLQAICASTL